MTGRLKNFRDLGGIPAADGKTVRHGMLYRSAHICKISRATAKKMRDRQNLSTVVDLRSPSELAEKSDVVASGVRYLHLPPLNDEQNPAVTGKSRRAILYRIMAKEGGARRHLSDTYRIMVTQKPSLDAFRQFLQLLKDEENAAVLWQKIMVVSVGEIKKDYLLTNRASRFKNAMIYLGVLLVTFSKHTADELDLLLKAEDCYLDAAFEEIDRTYGGTDGFLHSGLGLSDNDITKLREIYLV